MRQYLRPLLTFGLLGTLLLWPAYFLISVQEAAPLSDAERAPLTPVVQPGGTLIIKNSFTRRKACSAWFHRAIYDSSETLIFSQSEYRPAIGPTGFRIPSIRQITLPAYAKQGQARYEVTVEWSCNWAQRLWPRVVELPPLTFRIGKDQSRLDSR
ncbi:MAG: hypothetical protein AB7E66_05795 [Parvibaculaceae bacterium]